MSPSAARQPIQKSRWRSSEQETIHPPREGFTHETYPLEEFFDTSINFGASFAPDEVPFLGNPTRSASFQNRFVGVPDVSPPTVSSGFTALFVLPVLKPGRNFNLFDLVPLINIHEDII